MMMIKELIQSIFGGYSPVLVDGVPLSGVGSVDFEYIAGVLLFAVTLYCVLRIVEAVIRNL